MRKTRKNYKKRVRKSISRRIKGGINNTMSTIKSNDNNMFLQLGKDINNIQNNGYTLLISSIDENNINNVEKLIKAGADVNKAGKYGTTPLIQACHYNNIDIVNLLLNAGADVNKENEYGRTPLQFAYENGNIQIITKLLQFGANVNKKRYSGISLLTDAISKNNIDIVDILLKYGNNININEVSRNNVTALYLACYIGNIEIVKKLITYGADINKANNNGITPYQISVDRGNTDIANLLLKAGANTKMVKVINTFSDIENNIYNIISSDNIDKKITFKLGFTIKGKKYLTNFIFNGRSLKNGCIKIDLGKSSKYDEYIIDSEIKSNIGKNACFEPRLETTEKPIRITSTDVLQVLSTKLKVLLYKKSTWPLKSSIDLNDLAVINGVYISPYRILRGDLAIYEKYGYKNKDLDNFRENVLPHLKWIDIRDKLDIDVRNIFEKYNTNINDNNTIIQLMKKVSFEEEQKYNLSFYILQDILMFNYHRYTLDMSSPEWKEWDNALQFTDFELL